MSLGLKVPAVSLLPFRGCFPRRSSRARSAALDPEEWNGLWWDMTKYGGRAGGIGATSGSDEVVTIADMKINHAHMLDRGRRNCFE